MTNLEIIANIEKWQDDPTKHPLTCANNSNHEPLVAFEEDGIVKLRCKDCGYIQGFIPDIFTK